MKSVPGVTVPHFPAVGLKLPVAKPDQRTVGASHAILNASGFSVISRRSLLRNAALGLSAPLINRGRFALFAQSGTAYSALTIDLVRSATVIDMLGLVTLNFNKLSAWQAQPARFQHADFQKLKDSGITVFHPAVGYTEGDVYAESAADINGWAAIIDAHTMYFVRV